MALSWEALTDEQRVEVVQWVRGRVDEIACERDLLAEERGFDFVGAVLALADHADPSRAR